MHASTNCCTRYRAGASSFEDWYGTKDRFRNGIVRDLMLSWDAATASYTFASDAFHPADGIKVAALNARGHSLYYTAAMQVRAEVAGMNGAAHEVPASVWARHHTIPAGAAGSV